MKTEIILNNREIEDVMKEKFGNDIKVEYKIERKLNRNKFNVYSTYELVGLKIIKNG